MAVIEIKMEDNLYMLLGNLQKRTVMHLKSNVFNMHSSAKSSTVVPVYVQLFT